MFSAYYQAMFWQPNRHESLENETLGLKKIGRSRSDDLRKNWARSKIIGSEFSRGVLRTQGVENAKQRKSQYQCRPTPCWHVYY